MVGAGRIGDGGGASLAGRAGIAVALALALAACATPTAAPPAAPGPAPAEARPGPAPRTVPAASTACPTPVFPGSVRRGQASGLTRVTGEVQPDGTVRSVVVVRTSGPTRAHKALDRAAADALAKCRFPAAPGTLPAETSVDYRWTPD